MDIENEIFKRTNVNYEKLLKYGFIKNNDNYIFEKIFLDNNFQAIINVTNNGKVSGKVIDLQLNEEYTNIRTEMMGEFVSKVRENYKAILTNIRDNCFDTNYFIFNQSNRICKYIQDKYNSNPEFLWTKFPGYAIFRKTSKWFALIGNVTRNKVNKKSNSNEEIEIINVKVDEDKINNLISLGGYYEAYHMNKKSWISIILDDTLSDDVIMKLIDESYGLVNNPAIWIVPANPKYYDIVNEFKYNDEIIWKQSSNIEVDDIIYIYVAEPYSKVLYKCKATEVNIPYSYQDKNVRMDHVMKIKLLKDLTDKDYNFSYLNKLGIKTVRGPRKINKDVSNKLI